MTFKLSERSLSRMVGVEPRLVLVVKKAIQYTKVDFGVIEGLRTLERQQQLVECGASQTLNSKHLVGKAVDLLAFVDNRGSWEVSLYDEIADAVKRAAIEERIAIRWGGAWHVHDIRKWEGSMEAAMNQYIDERRSKGRRPFIDAPHFEMSSDACD